MSDSPIGQPVDEVEQGLEEIAAAWPALERVSVWRSTDPRPLGDRRIVAVLPYQGLAEVLFERPGGLLTRPNHVLWLLTGEPWPPGWLWTKAP